jgi:hypothetical protein
MVGKIEEELLIRGLGIADKGTVLTSGKRKVA